MLKIAKKYIVAFSPEKEKEILQLMKKDWHFEIIEKKQESEEEMLKKLQEVDYKLASVDFVISYLNPFSPKESIIKKLQEPKIIIDETTINRFGKEEIDSLIEQVVDLEKESKIIEKELKEKEELIREIDDFEGLNFVPKETEHTFSFILKEAPEGDCSFKKINDNLFAVIGMKEKKEEFLEKFKSNIISYNFEKIPAEEKISAQKTISKLKRKEEIVKKELELIAKSLKEIKIYHDVLCLEKRQFEVKKEILSGGFLGYVLFWATEEEKNKFGKELKGVKIVEVENEKEEIPPVMLENNRLVGPFQAVTDIFGLPSASELDPTPYLALSLLFFLGSALRMLVTDFY